MNNIINLLGKNYIGKINIPGDKSISIRAILIASFFYENFIFDNFNFCEDTKSALNCITKLYQKINFKNTSLPTLSSQIKNSHSKITIVLNCKNSGTTIRLLAGILCGIYSNSNIKFKLIGDKSLSTRPMNRIIIPLNKMGFDIISKTNGTAPLYINYTEKKIQKNNNLPNLHNFKWASKISSAQVKSCLELASFFNNTKLTYSEPYPSRNHTQIMLNFFSSNNNKMNIYMENNKKTASENVNNYIVFSDDNNKSSFSKIKIINNKKNKKLYTYKIPGDISTAAYFIANAIIQKKSKIILNNIGINNARIGFIKCLSKMGIEISLNNIRNWQGEKVANIKFSSNNIKIIKPINISGKIIPTMIDEIPLLAIILSMANGISTLKNIEELKIKESNRIKAITDIFDILSIKYKTTNDSLTIYGDKNFDLKNISKSQKKSLEQYDSKDHRILLILKLLGAKKIKNKKYLNISI